jgi:crossover junction endodeoxyribonuclease RusA
VTGQLPLGLPGVAEPVDPRGPAVYTLGEPVLAFVVRGTPIAEGRVSAFGTSANGRPMTGWSNAKTLKPWRRDVKRAAQQVMDALIGTPGEVGFPIVGPVALRATFTVAKPTSAPKRSRTFPTTRPDLSHYVRAIEDALTEAGVWRDDAQVIDSAERKVYPNEHPLALDQPGVRIRVYTITATPPEAGHG